MIAKKIAAPSYKTEAAGNVSRNTHHKLKTYKPLQGIEAFESLRFEWAKSHPHHSEIELLEACRQFAKLAGLNVREKLYQENIDSLRGAHD